MVAELDDGEDSISVPEMRERVLAKLNSSGAKYRLSNRVLSKSGIAEGGWVRINLSDFPAVEPMVKEKRKEGPSSSSAVEPVVKEERSAKKLKPFSRSPVALSATPEDPLPPELLRQVFLWVTDLRNILGTPIAIKPRQLMQLSLVCKRWDAIIRQNHKVLGYYPEQIMEINSEVEALKVAPLDASEMMGLALMAKQLLTHFNPDKYTYICLGNSPALIIELIAQSKKPPAILYLPISDIEELEVAPREKGGVLYERLLDYVARIMKDRVKTSHVLLVDMTSTGAALSSIKVLLDDYYQRKHELKTVEMVSLNVMSAKPNEELQHLPLSQIKSLRPESAESLRVAQKIVECRYKNKLLLQMFAKHPIIEIQTGKLQAPALQGPHYQRMREMVKGIIKILKQNGEALDLFA